MIYALLGITLTGLVFFLVRWYQMMSGYRSLTQVELRQAELDAMRDERAKAERTPINRLRAELRRQGLSEDLFPVVAAAAMLYLVCAVSLRLAGVDDLAGVAAALPASALAAWGLNRAHARRQRAMFNIQMINMLDLLVGQVQGGVGAERALGIVTPSLGEPLRGEMAKVLAETASGKDLLRCLDELRQRYPSRAFDMFMSALEIDRAQGHAIAPALQQAAAMLKEEFALAAEARAEVSSTRMEFLGVVAIIVFICSRMMFGGADSDMYFSGVGLIIVVAAVANLSLGIFRFFRILNQVRGDT